MSFQCHCLVHGTGRYNFPLRYDAQHSSNILQWRWCLERSYLPLPQGLQLLSGWTLLSRWCTVSLPFHTLVSYPVYYTMQCTISWPAACPREISIIFNNLNCPGLSQIKHLRFVAWGQDHWSSYNWRWVLSARRVVKKMHKTQLQLKKGTQLRQLKKGTNRRAPCTIIKPTI